VTVQAAPFARPGRREGERPTLGLLASSSPADAWMRGHRGSGVRRRPKKGRGPEPSPRRAVPTPVVGNASAVCMSGRCQPGSTTGSGIGLTASSKNAMLAGKRIPRAGRLVHPSAGCRIALVRPA